MHPGSLTAAAIIIAVGLVCTALLALALQARVRTGNRKLLFVAAAFAVFAIKSFVSATAILTGFLAHEHLELTLSLFDLAIVALLIAPFLVR